MLSKILSSISILFYYLLTKWNKIFLSKLKLSQDNTDDDDVDDYDDDDDSTFYINPCPNPNCIRCTKYREIQQSAKRRLPHLLRAAKTGYYDHHQQREHEKQENDHTNRIDTNDDDDDDDDDDDALINTGTRTSSWSPNNNNNNNSKQEFQRIIDGVTLYNQKSFRRTQYAHNQRPTVLLVPNLILGGGGQSQQTQQDQLQPPSIVTKYHRNVCKAFMHGHGHNNHPDHSSKSIRDVMLEEYVTSQMSNDANWIRNNANTIISSSDQGQQQQQQQQQCWEVLYLMNQGQWIQENIETYCPKTFEFLTKHLESFVGNHNDGRGDDRGGGYLMQNCIFGNIFFSVLHPGTIIEPHCGPTNIRHRLHFALSVPNTSTCRSSSKKRRKRKNDDDDDNDQSHPNNDHHCDENEHTKENDNNDDSLVLKVGNEKLYWEEGKVFVFDDSIVHSAEYHHKNNTNDDNEVRVVLVVDLWHPLLSSNEKSLLCDLYPPM